MKNSKPNRMSSLPIAQYCSAAGVLGRKHGSGRAAAMSRAFHALCAEEKDSREQFQRLSDEEQKEVLTWFKPATAQIDGHELNYSEAEKELEVGIDRFMQYSLKEDACIGHLDMCWIVGDGAYVGDIKKTRFSSPDGVNSLQMLAYGYAIAMKNNLKWFRLNHWIATEGKWLTWSQKWMIDDLRTAAAVERIVAAAWNTDGEYSTGSHCFHCWDRLHCQEYILPMNNPEKSLAPLMDPSSLTHETALKLLLTCNSAKDFLWRVEDTLKVWADRNGGIKDGKGKVWKRSSGSSYMAFDKTALEKDYRQLVQAYTKEKYKKGGFRWQNEK